MIIGEGVLKLRVPIRIEVSDKSQTKTYGDYTFGEAIESGLIKVNAEKK